MKSMLKYLPILFIFMSLANAQVQLSEVLPDPAGSDTGNEWIELYNSENIPIILDNYSLRDESTKIFKLNNMTILNLSYLVVFPTFTLNNDADSVFLYYNGTIIDSMTYPQSKENISFSFVNGNWTETIPTPGTENYIDLNCDFSVKIIAEDIQGDFSFKIYVERIKGFNGNLSLFRIVQTPYGEIIEKYNQLNLTVITHKTIENSPSLENGKAYLINASIITECNDSNLENNNAIELVFLRGENEFSLDVPYARITQVYGKRYEFGDTLRVRVSINKGTSNKRAITLSVENLSVKNSFQSYTKSPQDFEIYLKLPDECEKKSKTGNYTLRLEAFGAMDRRIIEVFSNKTCNSEQTENIAVKYESGPCEVNFTENIINIGINFSTLEVIYESAQVKAKNMGVYAFSGLILMLLTGLVIWKKSF